MAEVAASLRRPLYLLSKGGFYNRPTKQMYLSITIYVSTLIYILCLVAMQFKNIHGDIFAFASNLEAFCIFAHIFKIVFFVLFRDKVAFIVEGSKGYWSLSECSEELSKELNYISNWHLRIQKFYIFANLCLAVIVVALTAVTKELPLGVWTLENHDYLFVSLITIENLLILFCMTVIGVEIIFFALCVDLTVQIRLLCSNIESLVAGQPNFDATLRKILKQQDFILRILSEFRDLYAPILAVEFLTVTPIICTNMYALTDSTELSTTLLRPFSIICEGFMQIFLYSIPSDIVASEALHLADSYYNSKWYTVYDRKWNKILPLVIQNSQNSITFTAGGLMTVDTNTSVKGYYCMDEAIAIGLNIYMQPEKDGLYFMKMFSAS